MKFPDATSIRSVDADDLVLVQHVLTAQVATAFQREVGAILRRLELEAARRDFDEATWDSSQFSPPYNSNHRGTESAWDLPPITADDRKAIAWVVDNWTDTGRALVAGLLNAPAEGVHTFDLADAVGYDGAISSAFRGIAGRLRAIERAPFWKGDPNTVRHERGQVLSLEPSANLVRRVMAARYPALMGVSISSSDKAVDRRSESVSRSGPQRRLTEPLTLSPQQVEVMWMLLDRLPPTLDQFGRDSFGLANLLVDRGFELEVLREPNGKIVILGSPT